MRQIKGMGGRLCARKMCGKTQICAYPHSCQSMTATEAAKKQLEWDENQRKRNIVALQQAEEKRYKIEVIRTKLDAMLGEYDLCVEDLIDFLKEK